MQLRSIILYSKNGDKRVLDFQLGELNIVTGTSQTGKSALLDIVDFCLGRDEITLPATAIFRTVAWYAVMLQLSDTRVFVARPAPGPNAKSVSNGMIEVGADLNIPEMSDLRVSIDSDTIRQQLGRRIGIGDPSSEAPTRGFAAPLRANLGHAMLLCLQNQDEVALKRALFHRQNDEAHIRTALKTTIPYFLGAVPEDQAARQQELLQARRALRRAQNDLKAAQDLNRDVEARLRSLLSEARVHGLVGEDEALNNDRSAILAALRQAASFQAERSFDDQQQRQRELELGQQASDLRRQLRTVAEERKLLTDLEAEENDYRSAVSRGMSRLSALELVADSGSGEDTCPACGSTMEEPDPTVADMQHTLQELRGQLDAVRATQPRREQALRELDQVAAELRQQLRGIEGALSVLAEERERHAGLLGQAEVQAYVRGRIDAYLAQINTASDGREIHQLETDVAIAQRIVQELEEQLDADDIEARLAHSLGYVNSQMTNHARYLRLEQGDRLVRLDLKKLTVVTDAIDEVTELIRIGSGKNHVGYHLAVHLALHQYFVANGRPVPRFLMLDQPTQPYYPSDMAKRGGKLEDLSGDEDRAAVRRLFRLMYEVTSGLFPNFQMIVSDHADLPDPWFQRCVRYNWRDGKLLIPPSWLDTPSDA
ncbi:DUF3732 domain-containing protein [Nocardiopsis dassonvillei]|uniref:DUF3732 domain-containing protein n=1 Tax=Nocardiopsis dassonvillei TaxID=2014 RepID=UPI0020A277A8|nr:DUF3732 domain-containing protein [Nocardiopsis dassonvillei]MCP3017359.1 DUF3732 domain-containing protein [Nocardiopsis dassonvillei]